MPALPSIPSVQALQLAQVSAPNPDTEPYFVYCDPADRCPLPSTLSLVSRVPPTESGTLVIPATISATNTSSPRPSPPRDTHGIALEFGYKSAVFSPVDHQLLKRWLQAQLDRSADHYVVLVHTDDSGPLSRHLAQQRAAAVMAALINLGMTGVPELERVHDPIRRLVVVARRDSAAPAAASADDQPPAASSDSALAPSATSSGNTPSNPPPAATPLVPSPLPAAPISSENPLPEKLP